jgi:hypothetical protein
VGQCRGESGSVAIFAVMKILNCSPQARTTTTMTMRRSMPIAIVSKPRQPNQSNRFLPSLARRSPPCYKSLRLCHISP